MPILRDPHRDHVTARLQAIDVVVRHAEANHRDAMIDFYERLLELERKEGDHASNGGELQFKSDRLELRFAFDAEPPSRSQPIRLIVRSLEKVAKRFDAHGVPYDWVHGFSMTDQRIVTADPAQNRLELWQTWPF